MHKKRTKKDLYKSFFLIYFFFLLLLNNETKWKKSNQSTEQMTDMHRHRDGKYDEFCLSTTKLNKKKRSNFNAIAEML